MRLRTKTIPIISDAFLVRIKNDVNRSIRYSDYMEKAKEKSRNTFNSN